MGKYYAIGDIHGMLTKLNVLLEMIPIDKDQDTIVFLGDYLDRGPNPKGVVQRIIDLKESGFNVVALKGNHEAVLLKMLEWKNDYWMYREGFEGEPTLKDYSYYLNRECQSGSENIAAKYLFFETEPGGTLAIPVTHYQFLTTLKLYYETEDFIFVHAGVNPNYPINEQTENDLLWITEQFLLSNATFEKTIVHGHSVSKKPEMKLYRIGIDTGACYGGKLTCVCLPDCEFYSI